MGSRNAYEFGELGDGQHDHSCNPMGRSMQSGGNQLALQRSLAGWCFEFGDFDHRGHASRGGHVH